MSESTEDLLSKKRDTVSKSAEDLLSKRRDMISVKICRGFFE